MLAGELFSTAPAAALAITTPPSTLIHVSASNVAFYYDRFLLEADGNVRVTTSDGMTMTGDAFSMDLKLNRFVLAGHVHVQDAAGAQDGAALADFLDFNRIYFVPVTTEPDRWTFLNGDFAHPAKGREMPGDTFFFPDLGNEKPYIVADSAIVGSKAFVRFNGNRVDLANGLGAYVPTPSYYVNFSSDQHLGDNSLAGANWDATYEFAGSAQAISALHVRYDTVNKGYLSFEQHLSGKKAYAVFSINPMTRPSKFWDLVLSDHPSERFQVRTFTQLHTFQSGLSRPDESSQFTTVQVTQAFPQSFLQLNTQFTNFSLLPFTPLGYNGHGVVVLHPFQAQLTAQTVSHRIGHLPFYENVNFGLGYLYNSYGLQTLGGVQYNEIWQHNAGFQVYVPSFKIGSSYVQTKNYYVNASFSKSRQWNSTGHYIDSEDTSASISKMFDAHYSAYLNYSIQNLGDYYGALQSTVYPPYVPVVNGVPYPGFAAFNGKATFHTLALGVTYTNGGNFSASLLARKHDDFPKAIPYLFASPPLDILGHEMAGQYYLGEPPYDISADVRLRINDHMSIDLSRAYYFNFGNRGWSPYTVIQVTP